MTVPAFAVVGHPNKGKSSIVATLSQDESVRISPQPGTTTHCRRFPMRVDAEVLYELVDTPGFQRARRALDWMRRRESSAAGRPEIVRRFVEEHRGDALYAHECELLTPLLEGAGILYVVDGSRPYGIEYEAEMEILRWTARPRMALINMIGSGDHVDEWTTALGQYFGIVRRFDALTAEFDKRLELLGAFGQLSEQWRANLERAVAALEADRERRRSRAALAIAEMLVDMLTLRVSKRFAAEADVEPVKQPLLERYREQLRARERNGRAAVEHIYDHYRLQRRESEFDGFDAGLFSTATWSLFGLTRGQLLATAAVGGAGVGGAVDIAVGGTSLLLGAGIGALVGGASAWYSFARIAETRVLGLPLGGVELSVGPMSSRNLPYVVLGRALFHHALVARRSHASRAPLELGRMAAATGAQALAAPRRKAFEGQFARLRRAGRRAGTVADLAELVAAELAREGRADAGLAQHAGH